MSIFISENKETKSVEYQFMVPSPTINSERYSHIKTTGNIQENYLVTIGIVHNGCEFPMPSLLGVYELSKIEKTVEETIKSDFRKYVDYVLSHRILERPELSKKLFSDEYKKKFKAA